jgi:nucleoside-diphosphate-sugar epimerase
VVGLVRSGERGARRFAAHAGRSDLRLVEHDVSRPLALDEPVDFVVHAASQASPRYYGSDPVGTLLPNVLGTQWLLELARERGARGFLFFSSGEVYGEVPADRIPTGEGDYGYVDPTAVRSCYAESKRMGETMCASWAHQHGVRATIVRPFHTYGPGMALDDGRVYADFVADVVARRDIRMRSDGLATRAFCYLADATAGFFTVLLRGEAGVAYNVGNEGAEVSIRDLAQLVAGLFPERGLQVVFDAPPAGGYLKSPLTRNCPDTTRVRALGWSASTPLDAGFRRTVWSYE